VSVFFAVNFKYFFATVYVPEKSLPVFFLKISADLPIFIYLKNVFESK